jgi:tetratricopeptide (TPR) repeat protein
MIADEGDAVGAAAVLDAIRPRIGGIARFQAECYTLSRDYEKVHQLLPSLRAYDDMDTTMYYIARSSAYHFQKDPAKAYAYADSARIYMEARGVPKSDIAVALAGYGAVLAAVGREEEALRLGDRAVELMPIEKDALTGADVRNLRMIIYLTIDDVDSAIREIQFLMSVPSGLTPAVLRLHPGFDTLREDPRFKKLAEEKISL